MYSLLLINLLLFTAQPTDDSKEAGYPSAWEQTTGKLAAPSGITVLDDGTLVTTEPSRHRLTFINANGSVSHSWGTPGQDPGQLHRPGGLDASDDGTIAVADTGNHRICRIDCEVEPGEPCEHGIWKLETVTGGDGHGHTDADFSEAKFCSFS